MVNDKKYKANIMRRGILLSTVITSTITELIDISNVNVHYRLNGASVPLILTDHLFIFWCTCLHNYKNIIV